CGVANTIEAVRAGATAVQGTMNGLGERCGNANLCSIIPNLKYKLNLNCINPNNLKKLTHISREISELANLAHDERQPYVGNSAFAHKAGIHVSAIEKNSKTYEHIDPELVGNHRRVLVSELSGRSNVAYKLKELNIDCDNETIKPIVQEIKKLENAGYQFESAEASFELLILKALGKCKNYFNIVGFRAINEQIENVIRCEASIKVMVGERIEHTVADGNGPVNALDNALRKALVLFYPELKNVELADYKVRVLAGEAGTEAMVRVLIESRDIDNNWGTVGVSSNIVEASLIALVDSYNYYLHKFAKKTKKQH
ncbi:MAG TPA: alpha-isopropylmalate synthase regulatory domain-containing protein, partial [bacterium]|nr:alpha-isopropylmalate synthase regulatory domain-containing protein [bacterium]